MALNNFGLGFVFRAEDLATGTMRRVQAGYSDLATGTTEGAAQITSAMKGIAAGFAVFAAGAAALKVSLGLADAAGEFELALAGVGAVAQASAEEMSLLKNAAIEAGIATQFSPTEAVIGLRNLAQAGFSARSSVELLIPVLDLAAGSLGQLSPEEAAGLAAQTLKAFSLEAKDATLVTDKLLKTVNLFALSAKELPLAVGRAVRGASLTKQTLDETLISLGLIKNIIPGVELASTAVSTAMTRLVLPKTQKEFKKLGVDVVDAAGRFRPFLNVIQELSPAMDKLGTDQAKAEWLEDVFGVRALGGVSALMTQIKKGVRTNSGELVAGGDAIKYLRKQFQGASGTAKSFREQLLNTFEGQKILLAGSAQTAAILIGEPFAQVLKPIVSAILDILNELIEIVKATPAPIKRFVAGFILVASAVAMVIGAILVFKGAMFLLAPVITAAGAAIAAIGAAIVPIIIIIAAVIAIVAALKVAWDKDLGGMATGVTRFVGRVRLAFAGIAQLIRDGGFSGAILDEINRAENQGIKKFVITLFKMVFRVKVFFAGLVDGFLTAMDNMSGVFGFLISVVKLFVDTLGGAVRVLFDAMGMTDLTSERFNTLGGFVGWVAGLIVSVLGVALDIAAVGLLIVAAAIRVIIEIFVFFGKAIAAVAFAIWWAFAVLVPRVIKALGPVFSALGGLVSKIFNGIASTIGAVIDMMIGNISRLVAIIPASVRPAFLDSLAARGGATDDRALAAAPLAQSVAPAVVPIASAVPTAEMSVPAVAASSAQSTVAQSSSAAQSAAIAEGFQSLASQPIQSTSIVELDGEVIASSMTEIDRSDAARSFSSGPR